MLIGKITFKAVLFQLSPVHLLSFAHSLFVLSMFTSWRFDSVDGLTLYVQLLKLLSKEKTSLYSRLCFNRYFVKSFFFEMVLLSFGISVN